MFDSSQEVEVKWSISNKKHFEDLGYDFTAYKDIFTVPAKDLQNGSSVNVTVVCDYCAENVVKTYRHYNKQVKASLSFGNAHKDCCQKCIKHKNEEFGIKREKLSEETEFRIVEDYLLGLSYMEIRSKYKISESSLTTTLKRHKVDFRLNKWTNKQLRILEKYYPLGDWDTLLEKLSPFSKQSIHTKANKLGIAMEGFYWTQDEEQLLIEVYEEKSFDELIEIFSGRTVEAIQSKARNLGVRKKTKWTKNELDKLINMYEDYPNEMLLEFFPQRNINSIQDMASLLGIKKSEQASINYKKKVAPMLLNKLKEFAEELGRTPTSFEINSNPAMPGILTYHRHFETYSNACKLAGLDVNSSLYGRSYHLTSLNGDVCLSKKEQEITNFLINENISYEKEVPYKDIITDYNEKNIRCDWLLNKNIVVEYFGMPEKYDYKIRMNEKIELCKTYGIPLIDVYQKDILNNFEGLKLKLRMHNINVA